ncbi:MAG: hypothetical protein WC708_00305 [Lentisphaeria bacterium]|jgi:hypothetical protein
MNAKNREFEWPEQKDKQVVASIQIDDTPWTITVTAHAFITQKDGMLGAGPVVTTTLFYAGGSKTAATNWTLTSKDLSNSKWNPEGIIIAVHEHLAKREIPVPNNIDISMQTALNQARKNAFLAMVSGQAHALIGEVSYDEATSAWGIAEVAAIMAE